MFHHAEIIAVGSELLLGNVANTDAQYVSEKLAAVGVDVLYHTVVGDNPERLRQVTDIARRRCDLLIFIGGLGPTYDDLTKDTVCAAFGVATEFHEDVMDEISGYFKNVFRREMPDCNRRQAYLPKGCTVLHNPVGTAPGCVFTADGVTVAMLPGVPHECRYLTDHALLPYLQARQESMILSHTLHVFGLTEPKVQEELGDLMNGAVNPSLAPYAKGAEVQLRLHRQGGHGGGLRTPAGAAHAGGAAEAGSARVRRGHGQSRAARRAGADKTEADGFRRRELHRRAYRQAADGRARRFSGLFGRRGELHQRREARSFGRAGGAFAAVRRRVRTGGESHGGGRAAHHGQQPRPVGDGAGGA